MGSGASALLQKGVNSATEEELRDFTAAVPDEVWDKLVAARESKVIAVAPKPEEAGKSEKAASNPAGALKEEDKEADAAASEPPKTGEADAAPAGDPSPDDWVKAVLEAHNMLRAKHGAPPLAWNTECFECATKQSAKMQKMNRLDHDHLQGPSGRHGQNCFGGTGKEWTAMDAIQSWYDELTEPGYDFAKQGFTQGTGHFTQVVWKETRFVGMAKSKNGNFIAANYLPAGNVQGQFEKNVFPEGAAMQERAPDPKLGTLEATSWSDDVMLALAGCPWADDFEPKIKKAFKEGHTVIIEREKASIKLKIKQKKGSYSTEGGEWG